MSSLRALSSRYSIHPVIFKDLTHIHKSSRIRLREILSKAPKAVHLYHSPLPEVLSLLNGFSSNALPSLSLLSAAQKPSAQCPVPTSSPLTLHHLHPYFTIYIDLLFMSEQYSLTAQVANHNLRIVPFWFAPRALVEG